MQLRFCSIKGKPGWWENKHGKEVELVSNCITGVRFEGANEHHTFAVIIRRTGTGNEMMDELVIGNDTKLAVDFDINAEVNNGDHQVINGVTMIYATKFLIFESETVLKSYWDNRDRVI